MYLIGGGTGQLPTSTEPPAGACVLRGRLEITASCRSLAVPLYCREAYWRRSLRNASMSEIISSVE